MSAGNFRPEDFPANLTLSIQVRDGSRVVLLAHAEHGGSVTEITSGLGVAMVLEPLWRLLRNAHTYRDRPDARASAG